MVAAVPMTPIRPFRVARAAASAADSTTPMAGKGSSAKTWGAVELTEIANIRAGKLPQELPHHGQAAKPGFEYADGAVIHTARGIILVYCFQNPTPSSPPAGRPVLSAIRI